MIWLQRFGFVLALAFLAFTFVNASWLVGDLPGRTHLIANGGIAQDYVPGGRRAPCPARAILPPIHAILEDTARAVSTANRMGADLSAIDLVRTRDGALALFPDADLGCRTQASGSPTYKTLAELRKLDLGYGYSADGGHSFPLRGKGIGLIPGLADVLDANPRAHFLYRFPGNDVAAVALWAQALKAAGHDPLALQEGVAGNAAVVAAARQAVPGLWAYDPAQAAACGRAYRLTGWTGVLPGLCRDGTLLAPLDSTFTLWGWPNRLLARLDAAHSRVLAVANDAGEGLRHASQLPLIPIAFHGAVLVDNFWAVAPALHPDLDARTNAEAIAAQDRDEKVP